MAGKRLSDKMEKALNAQLTREAFQAQVYLAFGVWAETNHFTGVAEFLYNHATEERNHMFKFLKYIASRGGTPVIAAIDAPGEEPSGLGDCLNRTMQHEIENSASIDDLVNLAHDEKDWATFNFAQWFVKEQIEEETLVQDLLDKYNLASRQTGDNTNLYGFDRDVAGHAQDAPLPREETLG
ncbi:MAG: ferritin [Beijerinckiaceae bacterium]